MPTSTLEFSAFCADRGAGPLEAGEFMHESPWLNVYLYPAEIDYERSLPLAPTWHRIDSSVRRSRRQSTFPTGSHTAREASSTCHSGASARQTWT